MIPYGRQQINQQDIDAVCAVLNSDFLTQGPKVPKFEVKVATYVGAPYAVAVNSATSALHVACLALGLGPGDTLWTSPNTFVASANVARLCGAKVDFVDIDPETYNMCPQALAEKLASAAEIPKIVTPVHFAGQSCPMSEIHQLAKAYGFHLIEDASHAIGGSDADSRIGACKYSDICVFSFHPVKIITTGEGGLATTKDQELAAHMRRLANHGVTRDQNLWEETGPSGPWAYQQLDLGMNYRMTELQAALGLSQMDRIDAFVERRHEIFDIYAELLENLPLILPTQRKNQRSALHLYPIQIDRRDDIFQQLRKQGIGVNVHYIPVHTQPYYKKMGFKLGNFPNAEAYYSRAISLPMYPDLDRSNQEYVCQILQKSIR